MGIKLLFRLVTVTYVVALQSAPSYCTLEIIRPSARSKIQPLFLNMSSNWTTSVTTYYGRFVGPSDLVTDSVGTLRKVSHGTDSSEFEITVQFSFNDAYPRLILRSESASETLQMALYNRRANHVQTVFRGAECMFEVKRSREEEIEEYFASLEKCEPVADYYRILQFLKGNINKDGNNVEFDDLSKDIGKYFNITDSDTPTYGSNITFNRLAMMEDNVELNSLYFDVFTWELEPLSRHDISDQIMWRYNII